MQDLATTIAGYRLHEAISRDAVSVTYRASDADREDGSDRTVALQVSAPLTDGVERRRATLFQRRATAAMDVEHPGIARVLDAGIADDRAYSVTAWQPSVTLNQLIGLRWRLTLHEVVAMLLPAAEGLDRAHAAGVVHAALGTRSIRVTTDAPTTAFVTGFGFDALLALRLGSKRDRDARPVLDDLLYVAPEQLRGGRITPATDQYALACAVYHCLSGEPPFVRETASALFGAHLFARPPLPDVLSDDDNAAARAAIATGLAKSPEERHPSCTALLRAADVTRNGGAPVATPTPIDAPNTHPPDDATTAPAPAEAASPGPARRAMPRRLPMVALVALAAIAGLVAAFALIATVRGDRTDIPAVSDAAARPDNAVQRNDRAAEGHDATVGDARPAEASVAVAWRRPMADGGVRMLDAAGDAIALVAGDTVAALDPATGDTRWRERVDGEVTDATVTDDALVYRTPAGLTARALDDGRRLWTRNDQYTPTGGLSAASSGPVYGMGPGRILPELMAMDAATGVEQWHFHGEVIPARQNAAIDADAELVTILQNRTLFGLDPESELYPSGADRMQIEDEVFRVDVARPWRDSLTLLDDGVLLARRNGTVCSLARADATRQWCRRIGGARNAHPRLLVDGDTVVVVTRATVTALDRATGGPRWSAPVTSRITAATTAGTTVVVAERGGRVRGLDVASGDERWQAEQSTTITALAPGDGAVVAGTRDGAVLRFDAVGTGP
ncbi:MAG TPA: PQQ-binding-like beta-propeller repeat protein [Euzebyales bacterium]|nr:PQQ-binding-like beta-propeller repeat protein [Euzebyales bacterium]